MRAIAEGYLDVDLDRVLAALDTAPERFRRFSHAVHEWLLHRPVRPRRDDWRNLPGARLFEPAQEV